jgi:hypothetical protein
MPCAESQTGERRATVRPFLTRKFMQDSDIEVIETGAKPKHAPVNNYEPKEPTAEELKLAGVTLVGDDDTGQLYLTCDRCGETYFPVIYRPAPSPGYWICPNATNAP